MQEGQSQDQSWQGTVLSPNSQCKVAVASQPCCVRAPLLRGLATWQTAADRPLLGLQALAGPGSPSLLSPLSFSPSAGRRVGVILTVGYTGIALCELPQTPHPQASRHHTTGNPPQPCPASAVGSSQPRSSPTSWRVSSPQPPPPDATDTRAGLASGHTAARPWTLMHCTSRQISSLCRVGERISYAVMSQMLWEGCRAFCQCGVLTRLLARCVSPSRFQKAESFVPDLSVPPPKHSPAELFQAVSHSPTIHTHTHTHNERKISRSLLLHMY